MKKSRYEAAIEAVKLGRACLLGYFGKIHNIESKDKLGLVSEADRESERIIQHYLQQHCPDVDFLGEETTFAENLHLSRQQKGARWILDPLDGTTNYIHQFPIFCISLALEVDGLIELGIVDVPMLDQTFVAERGKGTFCNGKRVSVSKTEKFSEALLATGFSTEIPELIADQIQIFSSMVKETRGIRRAGAAAYDIALVSSGVFDLFWERNLKPWDTAAGQLLVEEAGGIVRTFTGQPFHPFESTVVAGNASLVEQFLEKIQNLKI
ncbi:inositol monophosphatase family protein [Pseudobdellovibrio exovorus]|uniref:Inositol-1-monophosphatase n=1 Tax=Pseudobdellovibrio exovorus JSS TaxID=1184267 RepID=M4VNW8_9BACT|nr:inositol monophosphatase family protein [Pseudobdellovibrio exovorus]AGH94824.1 putative myo-inositol-1(or 4)-monophosphatase [Pseudobdellovibrio exovorus JSS]